MISISTWIMLDNFLAKTDHPLEHGLDGYPRTNTKDQLGDMPWLLSLETT
jgi:hypothetical protein